MLLKVLLPLCLTNLYLDLCLRLIASWVDFLKLLLGGMTDAIYKTAKIPFVSWNKWYHFTLQPTNCFLIPFKLPSTVFDIDENPFSHQQQSQGCTWVSKKTRDHMSKYLEPFKQRPGSSLVVHRFHRWGPQIPNVRTIYYIRIYIY